MARVRELWERKQEQGWTQQKLGEAMGYPAESARKSVSQFLKSRDPQISMLRRFANAVGKRLSVIIQD
jgi:transcriptional regulator with XRE-family HTH domain